jgi:hypothetical protein
MQGSGGRQEIGSLYICVSDVLVKKGLGPGQAMVRKLIEDSTHPAAFSSKRVILYHFEI